MEYKGYQIEVAPTGYKIYSSHEAWRDNEEPLHQTGSMEEARKWIDLATPWCTMYHATTWKNWLKIQEQGLVPQLLPTELWDLFPSREATYLAVNIALAEGFLEGYLYDMFPEESEFALLEVSVPPETRLVVDPEMGLDKEKQPYAYAALDTIPAENVKLIEKVNA